MARVREGRALSTMVSSTLRVSGRMSTNTGTPSRRSNAYAVYVIVSRGMIISSLGVIPKSSAAVSSAAEHDWVRSALAALVALINQALQRFVSTPSPAGTPEARASSRYVISCPVGNGQLNGTCVAGSSSIGLFPRAQYLHVARFDESCEMCLNK